MRIVIDANPVISMLIKQTEVTRLFFSRNLELYAPEFLFEEIRNNEPLILSKSRLSTEEHMRFLRFRKTALRICPDRKDVAYFALALFLGCPIWSNDKKLKNQDKVKVYSTHELMAISG